jgi:hypothetical protein
MFYSFFEAFIFSQSIEIKKKIAPVGPTPFFPYRPNARDGRVVPAIHAAGQRPTFENCASAPKCVHPQSRPAN